MLKFRITSQYKRKKVIPPTQTTSSWSEPLLGEERKHLQKTWEDLQTWNGEITPLFMRWEARLLRSTSDTLEPNSLGLSLE